MPEHQYFVFTDKDQENKEKLGKIIAKLKAKYSDNTVDINWLQNQGYENFERLSRILLPKTITKVAKLNAEKSELKILKNNNLNIKTVNDFKDFIKNTKGLHIMEDSSNKDIEPNELLTKYLHLDTKEEQPEIILTTDNSDVHTIVNGDYLDSVNNGSDIRPIVYTITHKDSFKAAKEFKKMVLSSFDKEDVYWPDNSIVGERLLTEIYQYILIMYRRISVKASAASYPVVVTDDNINQTLDVIDAIRNPNMVIETFKEKFEKVNNETAFQMIYESSKSINDKNGNETQKFELPIIEYTEEFQTKTKLTPYTYLVTFDGKDWMKSNDKHKYVVFLNQKPVLDNQGQVMDAN